MDYCQENGNVVQIITGMPPRTGIDNMGDQAIWATEDEYVNWNNESLTADASSNSNHNGRQSQTRFGNETPNRKPSGDSQANNRSKAIGKMFFKTKMCCKFRAGTCPYVTNCNFAHSVEELRKPPPNWQEIVAAHEDERSEPREEYQIPSLGSSSFIVETQRSYKGRHCKKFYTEEGCPYGDSCTYLHDEQSRARESVAICLGPGSGGGYGGGGSNVNDGGETYGGGGGGGMPLAASLNSAVKPSNWKTRICNKWEQTGYCPFGSKCHFAHGATELHQNVGGLGDTDAKDPATVSDPNKQGMMVSKLATDNMVVGSTPIAAQSDGYHVGGQSQRLPGAIMRTGLRSFQKWKGPDKLSRIYGDWIDDIE